MWLLQQAEPVMVSPWGQIGLIGASVGALVAVVKWMMARLDKTIDALTKAVDVFQTHSLRLEAFLKNIPCMTDECLAKQVQEELRRRDTDDPQHPH
jgi:hypothetical protein